MRVAILAGFALAIVSAACQPAAEFDPEDPEVIAAIDAVFEEVMDGARNVDADRVLAQAETNGELTFITGDVMLGGLEYIREKFQYSYSHFERQDHTVIEKHVRLLSPDVAIVMAVSEGTYTDKAGWTSEPVGMGHTLVLVRQNGEWRLSHEHQSIAP